MATFETIKIIDQGVRSMVTVQLVTCPVCHQDGAVRLPDSASKPAGWSRCRNPQCKKAIQFKPNKHGQTMLAELPANNIDSWETSDWGG